MISFDQKVEFSGIPSNSHRQGVILKMVNEMMVLGGGGEGFGAGNFPALKWRGGKLNTREEKGGGGVCGWEAF